MGLSFVATVGGVEAVEEGIYDAEVARYEETANAEYGPGVKFFFRITEDGDYLDREVDGIASQKFSEKAKLRLWSEAAVGRKIESNEEFNLDQVVKQPVKIKITHKVSGDRTFGNVTDVYPAKRGSGVRSSAQPARRF